jgi:hypothetical protein
LRRPELAHDRARGHRRLLDMARVTRALRMISRECSQWRSADELGAALRDLRRLLASPHIPDDFRGLISGELDRVLLLLPSLAPRALSPAEVAALWAEAGAPTIGRAQ